MILVSDINILLPLRILDLYSVDLSSFTPNNVLKILLSVQSPILVNRGWVPRSWRDKFLQDLPVDEQSKNIALPSIQESERSSWWRFWSKKPKTVEVVAYDFITSWLMETNDFEYKIGW